MGKLRVKLYRWKSGKMDIKLKQPPFFFEKYIQIVTPGRCPHIELNFENML